MKRKRPKRQVVQFDPCDTNQFVEPELRSHVRNATVQVIWALLQILRTLPHQESREILSLEIVDLLIWIHTQTKRSPRWKYGLRFVSAEAKAKFEAGPRGEWAQGLRHEHVVQRKVLRAKLLRATNESEVGNILQEANACVVTKAEDARLAEFRNFDGWDRYRRAKIAVYDRVERRWISAAYVEASSEK